MKNIFGLFVALLFSFGLNAQTFKNDKSLTGVDVIQISTLKRTILGIETLEAFNASKDSIIARYNTKALGDVSISYEFYNDKYWSEKSYVKFYIYDFQTRGNLNTTFNLHDGNYTFDFYSNGGEIIKSFIGTVKRGKIVSKIE